MIARLEIRQNLQIKIITQFFTCIKQLIDSWFRREEKQDINEPIKEKRKCICYLSYQTLFYLY